MNAFHECSDLSDAIELFPHQGLYLKPIARLNISVQLPLVKLPGKTISNWEVMEKLRNIIKPEEFTVLKVSKSTLEFIRFEGEIESKSKLQYVIGRLDGRTLKLNNFTEPLKIRAAEAKISFPTRHTWDSYFRDAKNMNEMKPGERPDTIYISNLPCKWFAAKQDVTKGNDKPSEYIFRKVFEVFGDVRCVDIPAADSYRNKMKANISGINVFSFGQDLCFEGYVQFKEYICFVKAMDALRGMKLLYKDGDSAYSAGIKVDFDKTKHLSEPSIRRRRIEREKLIALEREEEERERMAQELEEQRLEEERKQKLEEKRLKLERQKQREEKRKQRFLAEMKEKENQALKDKIAVEERKLLIAQRKLESIRLLDELFERIKNTLEEQNVSDKEEAVAPEINQMDENQETEEDKDKLQEMELRRRLIHRYKNLHKLELDKQRERLQMVVEGKDPASSQLSERESSSDSESSSQISTERKPSVCGSSNHCSCCSKSHSTHHAQKSKEKTRNKWKEKKSSSKECKDYQKWLKDKQYHDNHQFYPYSERMEYYPHQRYRYQQYGNPRFAQDFHGRRLNQRRRGFYPYRRGDRGNFSQAHSQEYYEDINQEYYKYFRKLAKQDMQSHSNDSSSYSESRSKSGSRSSFTTHKDRSKLKTESKSKKISLKTSKSKSDKTKPDVMQEKDLCNSCGHLSQLNSRSRSRSSSKRYKDGSKLRFESTSKDASSRPSRPRSRKSKMKTKLHKSKRKSVSRSRSRSTSRSFSTSWSFSSSRANSWTQVDRAEHNGQIASVGGNDEKNVSQQSKRRKHYKKHKKHKRKTKSKN